MKYLYSVLSEIKRNRPRKSYSQTGEDMIIDFFFESKGISTPSYIDIGAHNPFYLSNTAFFYIKGSRGINIDANPISMQEFTKYRKKDINLNVGIGTCDKDSIPFYVMNPPTMSTFSGENAEELAENHNMSIVNVISVQMKTINSIIQEYCGGLFPDFLSLDAEGIDFEILKTIEYDKSAPKIICCETVKYGDSLIELENRKENEIALFLQKKGYKVLAETIINTIFVRGDLI